MTERRRPHDLDLLDLVDACARETFSGSAWRVIREGRDPTTGSPAGGRWEPGIFDVLYTSLDPEGALAEANFHLSRQPIFPHSVRWLLYRLGVSTKQTLRFADIAALEALGVKADQYSEILYERTQKIGEVAFFLEFDALIVPSARLRGCLNLVLFTSRLADTDIVVECVDEISWDVWEPPTGGGHRK